MRDKIFLGIGFVSVIGLILEFNNVIGEEFNLPFTIGLSIFFVQAVYTTYKKM